MTANVRGDRSAQQKKHNAKSQDGWNVLHGRTPRVKPSSRPIDIRFLQPDWRPVAREDRLEQLARESVDPHLRGVPKMIGEGEPLDVSNVGGKLDQAKEAVQAASRTVRETTQSVADAIE